MGVGLAKEGAAADPKPKSSSLFRTKMVLVQVLRETVILLVKPKI